MRTLRLQRLVYTFIGLAMIAASWATGAAQSVEPGATPVSEVPRFRITADHGGAAAFFSDVEVAAGDSIDLTAYAVNFGSLSVDLNVFKVNGNVSVNGGFAPGTVDEPSRDLSEWIDLEGDSFNLEPGESRSISFKVSVPEDTAPGQYVSGVMVQTVDTYPIPGIGTIDQRLGHVMAVSILVPGPINYGFELGEPVVITRDENRILSIPVQNSGNYLVQPQGTVRISNDFGEVGSWEVAMGSIYGGLATELTLDLPSQLTAGVYLVDVGLEDIEHPSAAAIDSYPLTVPDTNAGGMYVEEESVIPNADPLSYVNIGVTLQNSGSQLDTATVQLEVSRDATLLETLPLATNQLIPPGPTSFAMRYLPADDWESGTYTFRIIISAVDPDGAAEVIILEQDLHSSIVVP